jgi:hypothetical protein
MMVLPLTWWAELRASGASVSGRTVPGWHLRIELDLGAGWRLRSDPLPITIIA